MTKKHFPGAVFPRLPVIEQLKNCFRSSSPLQGVAIVAVQHLLESTGSLYEAFIELGCMPQHIHTLGKLYSANSSVTARLRQLGTVVHNCTTEYPWGEYDAQLRADVSVMWSVAEQELLADAIRQIIVLDDGGIAITSVPSSVLNKQVIGVEQTASGLKTALIYGPTIPVIEVASSAAKKFIEPPIIAAAVMSRVNTTKDVIRHRVSGVVGTGNIGRAMAHALATLSMEVLVFDRYARLKEIPGVHICESFEELWRRSEVIWGCSGSDVLADSQFWWTTPGERMLISCSSSDKEFRTALRMLNGRPDTRHVPRRAEVEVPLPNGILRIRNGGFPFNFDQSPESALTEDIQMTRGLLLAGTVQAATTGANDRMLSPELQARVVQDWFHVRSHRRRWYSQDLLDGFADPSWIRRQSGVNISPIPFPHSHGGNM